MMTSTVLQIQCDAPEPHSEALILELKSRMKQHGELMRLRAICDDGGLMLDAEPLEPDRLPLLDDALEQIVERAMLLLSSFYVHLASKRTLYSSDPLQALRNLRDDVASKRFQIDEQQFHTRLSAIINGLRDCHTNYYLPSPYRRIIVFLPFLVEAVHGNGGCRYLVTKVATSSLEPIKSTLHRQVEVTHVNGVPIGQVVARNGDESSGSNPEARRARGLARLTFRWLGLHTGPQEDWIDLRLKIGDDTIERRFEWLAILQDPADAEKSVASDAPNLGLDAEGEWIRKVKETLFHPHEPSREWTPIQKNIAAYRLCSRPGDPKKYGYLRVFTFEVADADVASFVGKVAGILRTAPTDGLVIDIRGNPGGNVFAAEGLLQLFSVRRVARQGIQVLNTPDAVKIAETFFKPAPTHGPKLDAQQTAAPFVVFAEMPWKETLPAPDEQVYQGPVVVIVDASCYSASEMFAAGMEDNGLAAILGAHRQTGGGGGVVWTDALIATHCTEPNMAERFAKLPCGASFEVAVVRTTRTGGHAGVAVEDMGIVARRGLVHELSCNDVLGHNEDLIACAIEQLDSEKCKPLVVATCDADVFTVHTRDVDRVTIEVESDVDGRRDVVQVASVKRSDQAPDKPFTMQWSEALERDTSLPATPPLGRVVFRGLREGQVETSFRWWE